MTNNDSLAEAVSAQDGSAERGYRDLHQTLAALEREGLLITVDREINKDTELHPLVRWQYRGGIKEPDRKAFLLTKVVDAKGRKYDIPVVVGALAASRKICGVDTSCELAQIGASWTRAIANPVKPLVVLDAPCQEVVITGDQLDLPGKGLDGRPSSFSTPGRDHAPHTTLSKYISKDPDSGIQNLGIHRGQVKAPRRLGINPSLEIQPGICAHWEKAKARGERLPAAVTLGCPPCVAFTSAQKLPIDLDELHVAGAPIRVVKCKTVDLLVPAEAEIVIEGFINTEWLEPEAPFGESHGHVNPQEFNAYMEMTAITHRRKAILTAITSQVTPSESSLIKRMARERVFLSHLTKALGIRGVKRVSMHEPLTNLRKVLVVGGRLVVAANKEGRLTLYTAFRPQDLPALIEPFEKKTGIRVTKRFVQRRKAGAAAGQPHHGTAGHLVLVLYGRRTFAVATATNARGHQAATGRGGRQASSLQDPS